MTVGPAPGVMTEPLERAAEEMIAFDFAEGCQFWDADPRKRKSRQNYAVECAQKYLITFLAPDEAMVERLAKVASDTPIRTHTFDMWGHMRGDAVAISDIVSAILSELRAIAGEKP